MSVVYRLFLLSMMLATPFASIAQDASESEPEAETKTDDAADGISTNGLSMGVSDTEVQIGQTYSAASHGDWIIRCVKSENGKDPCQLYQLLKDEQGNSVAEINMFNLPGDGPAVAGATVVTPLETLLTEPLRLAVDGGQARRYPYRFCTRIGCIARLGFTADEVAGFRRGASGSVTIFAAGAADQAVNLKLSLSGFTAGWTDMVDRNSANN